MASTNGNNSNQPESPPPYSNRMPKTDSPMESIRLTRLSTSHDDDIVAIGVRPSYASLRQKYNYSLAFNLVFVFVVVPLLFIGFTLSNQNSGNNNNSNNNVQTNASVSASPVDDIPPNQPGLFSPHPPRAVPPQRWCITGFSPEDLSAAFNNIMKNSDFQGRVYTTPCKDVKDLKYNNKGLKVEYDYVALN